MGKKKMCVARTTAQRSALEVPLRPLLLLLGGRLRDCLVAELNPAVQVQSLQDSAEVGYIGSTAVLDAESVALSNGLAGGASASGVLDVKHGLAGIDEGPVILALAVLGALLVYGELDMINDGRYDGTAILQANGHAVVVCSGCQHVLDVVDGVFLGQAQAAAVVALQNSQSSRSSPSG